MIDAFTRSYLMASVGVGLEVAFTGLTSLRARDTKLTGHSYLWMFPIYGLAYPLFAGLWPVVGDLPLLIRALIYAVAFLAAEYVSGWILRRVTGRCPWEDGYLEARWGVHGLIRLDYLPVWLVVGLLFERLYVGLAAA